MSDELNKQLLEWAQKAVQFGIDNVPTVVDQYIRWWTWTHIMGIVMGFFLLIGCYLALRYTYKIPKFWRDEDNVGWQAGTAVFCSLTGIIGLIILIHNIYFLVKIRVAPAVYIIDSLIK